MNPASTSFDVAPVLHLGSMSLKATRIQRLHDLAQQRGVSGPVELGKLIGKKTNQTSDLLSGKAPFGEKVARSIEEAADLPVGWLDSPAGTGAGLPFTDELTEAVRRLDRPGLEQLENVMRAHLGLVPAAIAPQLRAIRAAAAAPHVHPAPPSVMEELGTYRPPASTKKRGKP